MISKKIAHLQPGTDFCARKVAFVDQLQGLDMAKVVEYGEISDVEAARRFGVRNLKEFSFWAWRACGIANVAMILQTEGLFDGSLYELVCQGLRIDGYAFRTLRGREDVGWKHHSLCRLLQAYGLEARCGRVPLSRFPSLIMGGRYLVSSVKSPTGGHLVLVKGLAITDGGEGELIVNDPYTFAGKGGEGIRYSIKEFEVRYLGRSIMAWVR